jgi:hypothetical protein
VEPWDRLSEEIVHEGARTMARRRYRRPDGGEAGYDVILHGPVVSVLALTDDEEVVLNELCRLLREDQLTVVDGAYLALDVVGLL